MKKSIRLSTFFFLTVAIIYAQYKEQIEPPEDAEAAALAKATQNPLAAMYSLPFQNNTTFGFEPNDTSQNVLNIQPVIPVGLTDGIKLINRIIIPVVTQLQSFDDPSSSTTGMGDKPF
mgnify:CR=1 FL=1